MNTFILMYVITIVSLLLLLFIFRKEMVSFGGIKSKTILMVFTPVLNTITLSWILISIAVAIVSEVFPALRQRIVFTPDVGVLFCGGAAAMNIPEMKRFGIKCSARTVIVIHPYLKKFLSKREVKALIAHEEGHLAHDHLGMINRGEVETIEVSGMKVSLDQNNEIQADAFAAQKHGVDAIIGALEKISLVFDAPQLYEYMVKKSESADKAKQQLYEIKAEVSAKLAFRLEALYAMRDSQS